jgi:prephenate dehydratase
MLRPRYSIARGVWRRFSSITVAYQGEAGAYSQKATLQFLGDEVATLGLGSFDDVFKSVASGNADYGLVPIENSLGGSIHANYDLFIQYDLHIIGETLLRVEHCLLMLPGTAREEIKHVMSHPQALAQCHAYIKGWAGVEPKIGTDTAGSAKLIKDQGLNDHAAIASDLAGSHYGMTVAERNVEDDANNYTRFLLLGRDTVQEAARQQIDAVDDDSTDVKTSLVFALADGVAGSGGGAGGAGGGGGSGSGGGGGGGSGGTLVDALTLFATRGITLTKIESRPYREENLSNRRRGQGHGHGQGRGYGQQWHGQGKTSGHPQRPPLSSSASISATSSTSCFRCCYYVDAMASVADDRMISALHELGAIAPFVSVLGSYPSSYSQALPITLPAPAPVEMDHAGDGDGESGNGSDSDSDSDGEEDSDSESDSDSGDDSDEFVEVNTSSTSTNTSSTSSTSTSISTSTSTGSISTSSSSSSMDWGLREDGSRNNIFAANNVFTDKQHLDAVVGATQGAEQHWRELNLNQLERGDRLDVPVRKKRLAYAW